MTSHQANGNLASGSNFLRQIIEKDIKNKTYGQRSYPNGTAMPLVITRFPPEPNGYLHIGHAKSICLNFGLAAENQGLCHLRFDDTNPLKESQEYVDSIKESVSWLGYDWTSENVQQEFYASDYFDQLYEFACLLIKNGKAYVDSQTPEEIRLNRGTLFSPGKDSPYRNRSAAENLDLFERMKTGEFPDGSMVLRAKIDMQSPNINLRDPVIYRIRRAHHHRTGDRWCIYPMYDYTHAISDALEKITHSICTLEFEDHRPLYDWVINTLADLNALERPLPHQYEFARLNLTYTITSKRKLLQLVEENYVDGWDDPRMPTIAGIRRRGYTPSAIRLFCERIGVSKADSWIDISVLEQAVRDDLNEHAFRAVAVLHPIKLIIENYPEGQVEMCTAPNHPHHEEWGTRLLPFGRELWIEQADFMAEPIKGFFRLFVGNKVRLRYAYVIECNRYSISDDGEITVYAHYYPDSKSGTAGSANYKVKGNIHWLSCQHAIPAIVHQFDRLFLAEQPDRGDNDFLSLLNPKSRTELSVWVEPSLLEAQPETSFQFERNGYFVADRKLHQPGQKAVFNSIVGLKDAWQKDK